MYGAPNLNNVMLQAYKVQQTMLRLVTVSPLSTSSTWTVTVDDGLIERLAHLIGKKEECEGTVGHAHKQAPGGRQPELVQH